MSTEKMRVCLTPDTRMSVIPYVGKIELGREVRRLREERGLLQSALGPQAAISNIERGIVHPDRATLKAIAAALKVPLSHFDPFGGAYDRNAPRTTKRQRELSIGNVDDSFQLQQLIGIDTLESSTLHPPDREGRTPAVPDQTRARAAKAANFLVHLSPELQGPILDDIFAAVAKDAARERGKSRRKEHAG
jgi:transcriptional regulator with XRE-family HTH domain